MPSANRNYQLIAAEKKAQQWEKIPDQWRIPMENFEGMTYLMDVPLHCGVLSDTEIEITSDYDATALLEKLKARVWSVEQVTVAFCKRAALAQQLTNCLTEIFFDEAIERAKDLDRQFISNLDSKALPPLFGLPISLKDSFDVAGYDTSTGLGCYVDQPAESNSALAALLIDLGAVLYCKTNLPQAIMTGDSHNNVFGRTLNPRNTLLTAGGSTGGEGALIALRGSILGVGTDIAGSIRIPSLCNGIYGFRPSVGLIPHGGVRDLTPPGTDGVRSTAGPMATSARDCSLFLKAILQADTWKYDSTAISLPWQGLPSMRKLRIGVVQNDGIYTPTPPVRRGLQKAVNLLNSTDGVETISIDLPSVLEIYRDLVAYMMLLGNNYYQEQFARTGEPVIPSLKATGLLSVPGTTLEGFFNLNDRRSKAAKAYLKLFCDNQIDAIIMPPSQHTALPLDCWKTATYTSLWNYLDFPAVVIPVDEVADIDHADDLTRAEFGAEDKEMYSLYTGPDQYKRAPVAVQVVGYRHRDEALMRVVEVLDLINHKQSLVKG
ncbi:hypothetical protein PFICI_14788 [Pestalotiopsis fici W106-1]|uniref:Amidase domain-containing protein n=1 Tax=Pestalotiopsis fici (strain W106-1 / CGMCC3.15140) TaxID=1229662 RepID=W3WL14_PESFW|nr:uncharacterized protein PFICI_14788 [Pestalotiopsis fici W106-1]ETS73842.1 hypothetical protein PFICI_14788 [Pestalotiopsis fici W106-1]